MPTVSLESIAWLSTLDKFSNLHRLREQKKIKNNKEVNYDNLHL